MNNKLEVINNAVKTLSQSRKNLVSDEEYAFVKQYGKLIYVRDLVNEYYVDKIDQNKFIEGALKGMVGNAGDRYTYYMTKKEYDDLMTQTTGSYAGLGIYLDEKDGRIQVVAPIEDSPAEKAGIKSGDLILKVNDHEFLYSDIDKAMSMMKGKEGMKVKLTIYREGTGNIDLNITTAKITFKTVKSEMLESNIGYIRITTFDENTSASFNKALGNLKSQNMKGLIIDLRDNPGGLLDTSTQIADKLVGEGTVVYTINNQGQKEEWKSDADKINVPLVLLVNGGSASASEIVSGAVRDFKAGTIIGTKTFGKGLVQTIIGLKDGSGVKITIAKYYTPSGECIQGKGITPDIVLDLPEADKNRELKHSEDIQLQKAIEVIKSKQ
jgi:carboxyl-terminal processing protease